MIQWCSTVEMTTTTKGENMRETEDKTYVITVRFQFPAWNDKNGIESDPVVAASKKEAIKIARRQLDRDGHTGTAVCKGLQWFSAKEIESEALIPRDFPL